MGESFWSREARPHATGTSKVDASMDKKTSGEASNFTKAKVCRLQLLSAEREDGQAIAVGEFISQQREVIVGGKRQGGQGGSRIFLRAARSRHS